MALERQDEAGKLGEGPASTLLWGPLSSFPVKQVRPSHGHSA